MKLSNNILSTTFRKMKHDMPPLVLASVYRLFPLLFITSVLEVFGLVIIFPVINILLDPSSITRSAVLSKLYTVFRADNTVSFVLILMLLITAFFLLKNLVIYHASKRRTGIAYEMANRLATTKYSRYLSQSYSYFAENNTAVMLRNITQIPFEFATYVLLPFATILNELFILTILVVIMTIFDPVLFLSILLFTLPFGLLYNSVYRKKLREISERRNRESAAIYKAGMQSLEGFREIVVFNKLNYFKPWFKRSVENYSRSNSFVYLLNVFSPKIVETVAVMCISAIFISGFLFGKDIRQLGQFLVMFSLAAFQIIPSMNKIILSGNYIKSSAFTIDHFTRDEVEDAEPARSAAPKLEFKRELRIRDLSFRYRDAQDRVLDNVNLEVKKGETIGIIGPSGSGKSTLLNILLRLYKEQQGGIYVDDRHIGELEILAWYDLVSYVPQNITLLDGTITENIAFGIGAAEIDRERLWKCIERAQLSEFINSLPGKENTQVGENGIKLSGGQKQRIGIARALYHGGSILIFDEATSALDTETERMVTESIYSISHQDLTIIIVAHRLETLKYCDRIYKIEKGKIALKN
jgi:ABC-type multidrug transport system fused ATPase/permease subunit